MRRLMSSASVRTSWPSTDGRAAGRRQDAQEHADDGAFAAAVGAEQPEDRSALDLEGDVAHGDELAETAGEVLDVDGDVGHGNF